MIMNPTTHNSEPSPAERIRIIGRTYKAHAARHAQLAELEEDAADRYFALAARVDAADADETGAELGVLAKELTALNAESTARIDQCAALLNQS